MNFIYVPEIPWKATALAVSVIIGFTGCSGGGDNSGAASSATSSPIVAEDPVPPSDAPTLLPSPSPTAIAGGSPASSAAPSAMPTGDGSATPGDISPEKTKDRDLAVNDFFDPDDHVLKDGLYNVATLTDQKGVGATVGSGSQKVEAELRLANRYEKFTFNVGQANNSKSSDETLHVEVNKNGANDSIIEVPFNETRPVEVDATNVNALKIVLTCQPKEGTMCRDEITAVLYGMRLEP